MTIKTSVRKDRPDLIVESDPLFGGGFGGRFDGLGHG
jgi:hypothetical protein